MAEHPAHDDPSGDHADAPDAGGGVEARRPRRASTEPSREYAGTGVIGGAILLVLSAFALIVVTVQNADDVDFEFLWLDVTTPLVVIIFIVIAATIVLDEVVGFVWRRRRRTRLRNKAELERLRSTR